MDTSKIIRGAVSSGRYTVTAPIVKEDYGLYLQIEGVELPETYQVDFSNDEHNGTSVTMIGNADGVLIPRQFIDTGKDIFAFLYHVGADFGRTVYKFRIPNKVRPDRTNEEPTPEEQSTIDQCISALNEAVEQTAEDVESADQSAQSAQTYANNAQTSATSAQTSASQASASATASAQSASQSAQIKADVEDMVEDAQGYANSASQSASASAQSASDAQGYAQSASASASSASGYASSAQGSANTASEKAQDASGYAQTASQKATESAQSASQALTYKTDAESAKTASQTAQGLAESARDDAISAKNDAESARDDAESARDEAQQAVASISGALDDKADIITDTASGAIASFPDGANNLPLKSLVVDINPIQDLSNGDPSPENICPINGWTQVGVEQRGKNLFPFGAEVIAVGNKPFAQSEPIIRKGQTVTLSADVEWGSGYTSSVVFLLRYNNSGISNIPFNTTKRSGTWTATEDVYGFNFYATSSGATNPGVTTMYRNIQLELGSSATDYSPYTGRSITIDLGQTIYGGKLDVLNGVLTVDSAMVDLGTLSWNRSNNNGVWSHYLFYANIQTQTLRKNYMCSVYPIASLANVTQSPTDKAIYGLTSNTYLYIRDDSYSDVTAFKSAVTGQTIVYELAEPITIQLTPTEVNSLLGVNNIWADSGDTSAEYRADTKLYIERLTAPDSADMIADANITSGSYFMVGNSLYKATANIANGGQITVGTNCTRVSLAQALNEINA